MKATISAGFAALVLLTASCTTTQEGVVVSKGVNKMSANSGTGPVYWVELRSADAEGKTATKRVVVFEKDWRQIKEGQTYSAGGHADQSAKKPQASPAVKKKGKPGTEKIAEIHGSSQQPPPPLKEKEKAPKATPQAAAQASPTPKPKVPKTEKPKGTANTKAKPEASATPKSSGSLWQTFFGDGAKKTEAPPSPTPAPKKRAVAKKPPKAEPEDAALSLPKEPAPAQPKATPAEPKAPVAKSKPAKQPVQMTEGQKEAHFRDVQARAMEDKSVHAWKQKAHAATTSEEQLEAMREYRKALYEKMRKIDPALKDDVDKAEGATPSP